VSDAVRAAAMDQLNMRRSNLSLVLRELRRQPRSRAQLALDIDMTKGAVSSLVAELEERLLLRISSEGTTGTVGRPARDVTVMNNRALSLGLSLSVDYVVGAVVNLAGETIGRYEVPVHTPSLTAAELTSAVVSMVADISGKPPFGDPGVLLAGVAVGAPDLVDARSGIVRRSPTIGLTDYPLRQVLLGALQGLTRNIQVDNDANLAALAEFRSGSAAGVGNLIYLTGSTGIGGGILSEGRPFRGTAGYAGEVGHMVIDPRGAQCTCGNIGCWEAECGIQAFLAAAADGGDEIRDFKTPLDARFDVVISRARGGDPRTLAAIQKSGTSLGLGLSSLINIFNPDAVLLGGYFAKLFPFLIEPIRRTVHQRVMAESLAACRILRSELGLYAGAIGAAHLVIDQVMANPTVVPYAEDAPARIELDQLEDAS
jgi:predicted NBD/HSP70 family sugar kinase